MSDEGRNDSAQRGPWLRVVAVIVCAVDLLSGCAVASGARTAGGTGRRVAASTIHSYAPFAPHEKSAADLLAEVPGCGGVTVVPVATAAAEVAMPAAREDLRRSSTAASCSLRGHSVVLYAFADPGDLALARRAVNRVPIYFGAGPGWLVLPLSIGVPVIQLSAVQGVAEPLHGAISRGGS